MPLSLISLQHLISCSFFLFQGNFSNDSWHLVFLVTKKRGKVRLSIQSLFPFRFVLFHSPFHFGDCSVLAWQTSWNWLRCWFSDNQRRPDFWRWQPAGQYQRLVPSFITRLYLKEVLNCLTNWLFPWAGSSPLLQCRCAYHVPQVPPFCFSAQCLPEVSQ